MKGQMSISMTWIFAIFAGVVIFGLLVTFSVRMLSSGQYETSLAVLENIDSQVTSVAETRNVVSNIEAPLVRLQNLCQDPQSSGLLLVGADNIKPKQHQPIFSLETMEGRDFVAWTRDYTLHSAVDRFLYLATPDTAFIIVRNGNWESFVRDLPSEYARAVIDYDDIFQYDRTGFDHYRFILFDETPGRISQITRSQVALPEAAEISAINIMSDEVQYYEMEDSFLTTSAAHRVEYAGEALMYAAAFSQDHNHYTCNVEKTMFRIKTMAQVNKNRTETLIYEMAGGEDECRDYGAATLPPQCNECISIMKDLPGLYDNIVTAAEATNVEGLGEMGRELTQTSEELRRGRNCPTL